MGKGYLKHRGSRSKGDVWCQRCLKGHRCKYGNPITVPSRSKSIISYGERPKVMNIA